MEKIYNMVNRQNGVHIKCTEKYLIDWVIRGFEVEDYYMGNMSIEFEED
ncbi:hypothetical protein GCM10023310_68960 [Paenibacillus vulneris]